MKKTIAKLTLLQHGLIREARALDEMYVDTKVQKKKEETLEDKMEEDAKEAANADRTIERIGKSSK